MDVPAFWSTAAVPSSNSLDPGEVAAVATAVSVFVLFLVILAVTLAVVRMRRRRRERNRDVWGRVLAPKAGPNTTLLVTGAAWPTRATACGIDCLVVDTRRYVFTSHCSCLMLKARAHNTAYADVQNSTVLWEGLPVSVSECVCVCVYVCVCVCECECVSA